MAVEQVSVGYATRHGREAHRGDPILSDHEALEFLAALRRDRQRCHSLNSGPRLLREAVEAGLADPTDLEPFIARMAALRDRGLADWTPARHDPLGDDLAHAAEFHVTAKGRDRLEATHGRR